MKRLDIHTSQNEYPIIIGSKIIHELPFHLNSVKVTRKNKIMIITDDNVAPLYLQKLLNVLEDFDVTSYIVPAGEHTKSLEQAEKIITYAIEQGMDRSSVVLALGGGVVGDLAGFVSAVYMRGISFIQCPTTILAHDSSVGGKVGINHPLGKNLIGAFHQPKLVFYDTSFLTSLPNRDINSGLAEVIKHGLISDVNFASWLDDHANSLLNLDLEYVNEALFKGVRVKASIVGEDEKEQGIRAVLNYGHTLAHVIETISDYGYLHGEAVAIGMVFASKLANKLDLASDDVVNYTVNLITKFNLPTSIPAHYNTEQMLNVMMRDKKFKNNRIRMVLPISIGEVTINEILNKNIIHGVIEEIKK